MTGRLFSAPLPADAPLPPVPDRVRCLPFWRPFGALVVDGLKDETRGRPWDEEPAWIAVYNTGRTVKLQPAVVSLPAAWPYLLTWPVAQMPRRALLRETYEQRVGGPHLVIGLAYVTGSRPLVPADLPRSFFYEAGRHLWIVARAVRFAVPLELHQVGIETPPQNFAYADGRVLRERMPRIVPAQTAPTKCPVCGRENEASFEAYDAAGLDVPITSVSCLSVPIASVSCSCGHAYKVRAPMPAFAVSY